MLAQLENFHQKNRAYLQQATILGLTICVIKLSIWFPPFTQIHLCPIRHDFNPSKTTSCLPNLEENILEFWREKKIYDRSLEQRTGQQKYVFFEGPPTANGKPQV